MCLTCLVIILHFKYHRNKVCVALFSTSTNNKRRHLSRAIRFVHQASPSHRRRWKCLHLSPLRLLTITSCLQLNARRQGCLFLQGPTEVNRANLKRTSTRGLITSCWLFTLIPCRASGPPPLIRERHDIHEGQSLERAIALIKPY